MTVGKLHFLCTISLLSLVGCAGGNSITTTEYKSSIEVNRDLKSISNEIDDGSALWDIINRSDIQNRLVNLSELKYDIKRVEAELGLDVKGTADSGFSIEKSDITTAFNPAITASKTIYDSGNSSRKVEISRLNLEIAQLETAQTINEKIALAINAKLAEEHAASVYKYLISFDKYYEKNKDKLDEAVQFGVVTKSKMLELSQSLMSVDAKRIALEENLINADFLKSQSTSRDLGDINYNTNSHFKALEDGEIETTGLQVSELKKKIADLHVLNAEGNNKLTVQGIGRLSTSTDSSDNETLGVFVGAQFVFPIYDSGRAAAEISSLGSVSDQLALSTSTIRDANFQERKVLKSQKKINKDKEMLLLKQLKEAKIKKELNEDLIVSGQVNLSEIVMSVISELELKISLAENQLNEILLDLELYGKTGMACLMINLCEEIDQVINALDVDQDG